MRICDGTETKAPKKNISLGEEKEENFHLKLKFSFCRSVKEDFIRRSEFVFMSQPQLSDSRYKSETNLRIVVFIFAKKHN